MYLKYRTINCCDHYRVVWSILHVSLIITYVGISGDSRAGQFSNNTHFLLTNTSTAIRDY